MAGKTEFIKINTPASSNMEKKSKVEAERDFFYELCSGVFYSNIFYLLSVLVTNQFDLSFLQFLIMNSVPISLAFLFSIPASIGAFDFFMTYGLIVHILGIKGPVENTPDAFYLSGFSDLSIWWNLVIDLVLCIFFIGIASRILKHRASKRGPDSCDEQIWRPVEYDENGHVKMHEKNQVIVNIQT
ncbi:Hypothetical predicted protein [Cloeon dipterum]|uniref:Transmembrane protein n=1 Tax=Cloeon dipterum TaxID=197152 RepID=A0A8S1DJV8_9INSE|nr:Hypothetical predicted protein [Cloeon dipterum]CAB3380303.1 Hypothetical predicted protein [Cloeon dipterum]